MVIDNTADDALPQTYNQVERMVAHVTPSMVRTLFWWWLLFIPACALLACVRAVQALKRWGVLATIFGRTKYVPKKDN
jgi:hypothetical protein